MAPRIIPAKRRLCILLLVATWAALVLCAATEEASHSCRFSSPALSHDHAHHAHHHYDHGHQHQPHVHDHNHDHDHGHGEIQSRKLPEELAEEEDLAREGFGFLHNHHHHHFHSKDAYERQMTPLGIWIRAMGCSLLVSLASLICLIILPLIFLQGKPSRAVVDYLAVFGAGAMLGDAFLHQLPHAFGCGLGEED